MSTSLPAGYRIAIRVDYFGPLPPVTPRGITYLVYILLFTGRFSRCSDTFAADVLINRCKALGMPRVFINRHNSLREPAQTALG